MYAILLDYTFQKSSPFIDTAINEHLRQRGPLVHDCLSPLFHSFKQSSQYTCYNKATHTALSTRFKSGLFAGRITDSTKVTFLRGKLSMHL